MSKPVNKLVRIPQDLAQQLEDRSKVKQLSQNTLIVLALRAYLGSDGIKQLYNIADQLRTIADGVPLNAAQLVADYVLPLNPKTPEPKAEPLDPKAVNQITLSAKEIEAIEITESQGQIQPTSFKALLSHYPDYDAMLALYYSYTPTDPYPEDWLFIRDIIADNNPEVIYEYPDRLFEYEGDTPSVENLASVITMMSYYYRGCSKPLDFRKSQRQPTYTERVETAKLKAKEQKLLNLLNG